MGKSLNLFENHIILNWIRKGRKLTSLIEEQFDLYNKLFIYLLNNICKEDDFQEWKEILDNTKYVYPANEKEGWAQIFGETPNILEKVDSEKIQEMETETEEENKQEKEARHSVIEMETETEEENKQEKEPTHSVIDENIKQQIKTEAEKENKQ